MLQSSILRRRYSDSTASSQLPEHCDSVTHLSVHPCLDNLADHNFCFLNIRLLNTLWSFHCIKQYLQLINFSLLLLVTSTTDQRTGNHRQITVTVQHSTIQYSTVQYSTEQPRNLFGAGRPRLGMVGASSRPQSSVVARPRAGEVTLGTRDGTHRLHLRCLRGETKILKFSIKKKQL